MFESYVRIAIPKKGELAGASMRLLGSCGLTVNSAVDLSQPRSRGRAAEIVRMNEDKIQDAVQKGIFDLGITGPAAETLFTRSVMELCLSERSRSFISAASKDEPAAAFVFGNLNAERQEKADALVALFAKVCKLVEGAEKLPPVRPIPIWQIGCDSNSIA